MKVNKFYFSKSVLQNITINKYLAKHEYPKFFIRNGLKKTSKTFLLDNYSEFYEITFKKYLISMRLRLLKVGYSLVKNVFFFTSIKICYFISLVLEKKKKK